MSLIKWIIEHPQIAIVAIAVLGWLFNKLVPSKTAEENSEPVWFDESDFEPERETTQGHPSPVTDAPPPRRVVPPPLSVVETAAGAYEREQALEERLRQIRSAKREEQKKSARKAAAAAVKAPADAAASPVSLRRRLKSRKEVRTAIILNEILGPPAGLK